jgi:hypothetical protein
VSTAYAAQLRLVDPCSQNALVTLNFEVCSISTVKPLLNSIKQGPAVSNFGAVGQEIGPYTARIDDGRQKWFNGTTQNPIPRTILYHDENLHAGRHILIMRSQGASAGQGLAIDYAQIYPNTSMSVAFIARECAH